jgi:hypothetical protein
MNSLARFDDAFGQPPELPPATLRVPNGFYTLELPDGSHRTFRIFTKRLDAKFAAGKRVIGILIGPENTSDYESVAFLTEAGPQVWKRHRGTRTEAHLAKLWGLATGEVRLLTLAVTEVFGRLVAVDPKFLDLVAEHNRLAYERRDRKARKRAEGKGKKKRKAGKQEEESPGRESG